MATDDGLDLARRILAIAPEQVIVLHSAFVDGATTIRAARLGLAACIEKTTAAHLLDVLCPMFED